MTSKEKKPLKPLQTKLVRFDGEGAESFIQVISNAFILANQEPNKALLKTGGGPVFTFGPTPTIYTFDPLEILYCKLHVNLQPLGYSYLYGSGIYRDKTDETATVDLDEFMTAYFDGDLSGAPNLSLKQNLYNLAGVAGAPHIVVKKQCFVVIELNSSSGLVACENHRAIDTGDGNAADDYCDLRHYDAGGLHYPMAPASCTLFAFSVENPDSTRTQDQYNLYLQMGSGTSAAFLTVDPYIKNRGGKPPLKLRKSRREERDEAA